MTVKKSKYITWNYYVPVRHDTSGDCDSLGAIIQFDEEFILKLFELRKYIGEIGKKFDTDPYLSIPSYEISYVDISGAEALGITSIAEEDEACWLDVPMGLDLDGVRLESSDVQIFEGGIRFKAYEKHDNIAIRSDILEWDAVLEHIQRLTKSNSSEYIKTLEDK